MNLVVLVGQTTKPPEVRYTPQGKAVATVYVEVTSFVGKDGKPWKDKLQVTCWQKPEELVQNIGVGDMVMIQGRIGNRSYEDKQGQKKWVTEINASSVEKLSGDRSANDDDPPF